MKITTVLASASLSLVPLTAQAHAHAADHHDLTMVLIGMDMNMGMNMGMSMGVAAALTASVLLVRMAWRKQPRVSASTKAAT